MICRFETITALPSIGDQEAHIHGHVSLQKTTDLDRSDLIRVVGCS